MAKRQKKSEPVETVDIQDSIPATNPAPEVAPAVQAVPAPKPAVSPSSSKPAVPKKRVRVRKKTTKHLSVAVLCNNSAIRRFI